MPFLSEYPPLAPDEGMNGAAKVPCSVASALCPVGVAHVSRLIGNFDTTANHPGWQVTNGVITVLFGM